MASSTWFSGIDDEHLNRLLTERAQRQGGTTAIATGSDVAPGFVFMRPPCRGDDCPDWPPGDPHPDDPCRGQTWVWQPDLAARLILDQDCPSAADLARLQQVLGGNLSRFRLPDPDVRASCSNRVVDILVWGTKVAAGSCSDLARKRARIPDDIANGGNFGVYVSAALIRRLAQEAFDAAPKRLYANGFAGADGPIHLTGLAVGFEAPNVVRTIISGYDERPWPDVSFTTTITDRLLERRACASSSDTVPSRFDEVLAALFAALTTAVAIYVPVLMPLPAFVLWTDLDAVLNQPDNPSDGGVGCRLLEGLPDQIALPESGGVVAPFPTDAVARRIDPGGLFPRPKRQKLVIPFNQPRVDDRGILASALVSLADRVPAVQVSGASGLSLDAHSASTYGYFGARVTDFFGRLTFSWSVSGANAVIASPNAPSTKIVFNRGNAKPGDSLEFTITVRVTDVEGSSVTATHAVGVFVATADESLPPICKVKPWLAICSPGD